MSMLTGSNQRKLAPDPIISSNRQAIYVENVTVTYRYDRTTPTSLKEFIVSGLTKRRSPDVVNALNNVSLKIEKGEVFGVIGRNGAGKSSLLRAISQIIRPQKGRIRVWGKVSALLAVGAGFHQELTGRENVFLYSSLLGRSNAETEELFPGIVEFAEIADFIDSPLRTYSTGMIARLGFAIAMAKQEDILLVDEVLAVGDEMFREKCRMRFLELQDRGTTIVIVSHSLVEIASLCNRATLLENGSILSIGDPNEVVKDFRKMQEIRKVRTIRKDTFTS